MKTLNLSKYIACTAIMYITSAIVIADSQVVSSGRNTQGGASAVIDYKNAIPMPLPQAVINPGSQLDSLINAQTISNSGVPGVSTSGVGNGKLNPVTLVAPSHDGTEDETEPASKLDVDPQAFGTSNHVFTTSRTNAQNNLTTRSFPFAAAGKLFFKIGTSSYVCSASLVKRGVIVTAAHCVANFGKKTFYSGWQFAPAYDQGVAPYGTVTAKTAMVLSSYYNGTDSCAQSGVVCQNDVAVIVLNTNVGTSTGWYAYGWNGYGYANNQALITQLGYPVSIDSGTWQQRTDSQGFVSLSMSSNTVIGSAQTGGSSGGPWVVNLGIQGVGYSPSTGSNPNVVVGVTSWGYTSSTVKEQGASSFTSTNIVSLVNSVCVQYPSSC